MTLRLYCPWWRKRSPDRRYSRRAAELERAHSQSGSLRVQQHVSWLGRELDSPSSPDGPHLSPWQEYCAHFPDPAVGGLYRICIVSQPRITSYEASDFEKNSVLKLHSIMTMDYCSSHTSNLYSFFSFKDKHKMYFYSQNPVHL